MKKAPVYKKRFWLWISWKSPTGTCTSYNKTGVLNASWVKQWKRRNTSLWSRQVSIIIIVITVSTVQWSGTLGSCCKTKAWCNTVPLVHDLPKWSKKSHSWALLLWKYLCRSSITNNELNLNAKLKCQSQLFAVKVIFSLLLSLTVGQWMKCTVSW